MLLQWIIHTELITTLKFWSQPSKLYKVYHSEASFQGQDMYKKLFFLPCCSLTEGHSPQIKLQFSSSLGFLLWSPTSSWLYSYLFHSSFPSSKSMHINKLPAFQANTFLPIPQLYSADPFVKSHTEYMCNASSISRDLIKPQAARPPRLFISLLHSFHRLPQLDFQNYSSLECCLHWTALIRLPQSGSLNSPLTPSQAALVLSNTLSHTHSMPIQEHPMELHHSLHVI